MMDKLTKKRFLILFIAVIVIINISALSTIYYKSKIKEKKNDAIRLEQEQIRKNGMYRFFKEQLNLSDEQFHEFMSINKLYMGNAHNIGIKLKGNKLFMIDEIAKLNPNIENLDSIAKEIGNLHYELKLNTINHFIELKGICNDQQQEILQTMFKQMIMGNDHKRIRKEYQRGKNRKYPPKRRVN